MTDEHRTYDRWSDNDLDIDDLMRPAPIPLALLCRVFKLGDDAVG